MRRVMLVLTTALFAGAGVGDLERGSVGAQDRGPQAAVPQTIPAGASRTVLPDGRVLVVGGQSGQKTLGAATVSDPQSGRMRALQGGLATPRWGHSATLLPDGSVLIVGGIGADGSVIAAPERLTFDDQTFAPLGGVALVPRARHTATLLTDGRVYIAGGIGNDAQPTNGAEFWDSRTNSVQHSANAVATDRRDHTATLLSDGSVLLWGGETAQGVQRQDGEILDPQTETASAVFEPPRGEQTVFREAVPADGSASLPLDTRFAIRFSGPVAAWSVAASAIRLKGSSGDTPIRVVLSEGGRLLWMTPSASLAPEESYTLTVPALMGLDGTQVPAIVLQYWTGRADPKPQAKQRAVTEAPADSAAAEATGAHAQWQSLPPLRAASGVTALAGQALRINGQPLADVTLEVDDISTRTDRTGRFLLQGLAPGHHELVIDGTTAGTRGQPYGVFEVGVNIAVGRTTVLPYTIWMTPLDKAHEVTIASPTTGETVITTPRIPGLEVRLPAGSVVKDRFGRPVTRIGITPIPIDRPPFPLPPDLDVPTYFTVQPGGAYIYTPRDGPRGARLIYPNPRNYPLGKRMAFWHYEPDERGWYMYGQGTVMGTSRQIVPDPGVTVYEFTGAMVADPFLGPQDGPAPSEGDDSDKRKDGDPVDLGTGLFVRESTDVIMRDVLPIALTRTYRQRDARSRPFGIGATHGYEMFVVGATNPWTSAEVILPDGGRVRLTRITPGGDYQTAVFEHTETPSRFLHARMAWNGDGWDLTLKDGTVYVFPEAENVTTPGKAALVGIRDRHGNTITLERSAGRLVRIASPNGRWIKLTYDTANRITRADDSAGRYVQYTYDTIGRLSQFRDVGGGTTEYTYDAAHQMLTIKDARGNVFLTNEYDTAGRVFRQTLAATGVYQFAYTTDANGRIVQTDVTNPRGYVRRVTFNPAGHMLSDTSAFGTPEAYTVQWVRQPGTNLALSVSDSLGRTTAYTHDTAGNVASVTLLSGSANPVTTSYVYNLTLNKVTSVTDPLNHTTTIAYDSHGSVASVTNPLSHQTTYTYDAAGQMLTMTTPAGVTRYTYQRGDLVAITDPVGRVTQRAYDALGRVTQVTNPEGHSTRFEYNAFGEITKITDALGQEMTMAYDANRNLLSVTDARNNTNTYTYDVMNRLASRTDPLTRTESYTYDGRSNLTEVTDRKSQITTHTYDPMDRRVGTTYHGGATTTYVYDVGGRQTQIVDSVSGTITRAYDLLDRLTSETTPEGTVSYTHDAASRRSTMTVSGQSQVDYSYDNANRLLAITRGAASVGFTYDNADRKTVVELPNGNTIEYTYDAASQISGLAYRLGASLLGDLTYEYDGAGRRTSVGGTWARTHLPAAIASAAYDAANQTQSWAGRTFTYDNNGSLTDDGLKTYTWNARNQLVGIAGGFTATYQYDALDRRRSKTIGGSTTAFLYDESNVAQELIGGLPSANIVAGQSLDSWLSRTDAIGAEYILTDALGSTVALADSTGAVQTEYTYEPFGVSSSDGLPGRAPFQFTGREYDGQNLAFYRARYYDSGVGRFVSEDPLQWAGGSPSFFAYVNNSPINETDPTGLGILDCIKCAWKRYGDCADQSQACEKQMREKYRDLLELCDALGKQYPYWGNAMFDLCFVQLPACSAAWESCLKCAATPVTGPKPSPNK